ncbi:MAG: hypothetical protein QOE70_5968 [Chthoniobacter sp.]|jgi:hypothetical protein|nr:hypothetical protein [Chthoniobacter sp.]
MKKKKLPGPIISPAFLSDTNAGESWLSSLTEPEFRDEILKQLFSKMKKAGVIDAFENIHGRNDKGIDYLLVETTILKRRIVGIQVKSKGITRTGDGASLSSLDVKRECEAAMDHEFILQRDKVRLDNVDLWTSAHITEDAEKEFTAPGGRLKIQVSKATTVFALLEKFCPDLIAKIPQCALAQYIVSKSNPIAKGFKLLGVPLNPKRNFLLPTLSRNNTGSLTRLAVHNRRISPKREGIILKAIVSKPAHTLIKGNDLCGKTYLLEHLQCLVAETFSLPFMLTTTQLKEGARSIHSILSKVLPSLSPRDIQELVKCNRAILLIDDFDELEKQRQDELLELNPNEITVLGTAHSSFVRSGIDDYYITGVDYASIPKFLRSLDQTGKGITFTDRAHSFISRSLASSGLPDSPFTVAMLLQECQLTPTKFSTPTMGRLIERFIELQLGSHSDSAHSVDFESKREFLTRLAGKPELSLTVGCVKRLLQKHIASRSLPHDPETFYLDLMNSGVFSQDELAGTIAWSHPVIKQFFWVRSLVSRDKLAPITRILTGRQNATLAAIAGSQMKNAIKLMEPLIDSVAKLQLPSREELVNAVREVAPEALPSKVEEDAMLDRIERLDSDSEFAGQLRPVECTQLC